jgi:hypothetical protein
MEKKIAEFKGSHGIIAVYETYLSFVSTNIFGIRKGGSGSERRCYYENITAFDYRKPTFFSSGYFKALIPGTWGEKNKILIPPSLKKKREETYRIWILILAKIEEAKKTANRKIG